MITIDHKVLRYKLRLSFLKLITTQNFFNPFLCNLIVPVPRLPF